jgi:hypothetical protein
MVRKEEEPLTFKKISDAPKILHDKSNFYAGNVKNTPITLLIGTTMANYYGCEISESSRR